MPLLLREIQGEFHGKQNRRLSPVGGGVPMLCGMSIVAGAYTLPQYACKVQRVITKYSGFSCKPHHASVVPVPLP